MWVREPAGIFFRERGSLIRWCSEWPCDLVSVASFVREERSQSVEHSSLMSSGSEWIKVVEKEMFYSSRLFSENKAEPASSKMILKTMNRLEIKGRLARLYSVWRGLLQIWWSLFHRWAHVQQSAKIRMCSVARPITRIVRSDLIAFFK